MSRRFAGTGGPNRIHLEAGAAASWTARGAFTFAVLWKPATSHNGGLFTCWTLADDNRLPVNDFSDGHVYFSRSGFASDAGFAGGYDSVLNLWQAWLVSVPDGSATPRFHRYVYVPTAADRVWEHTNGSGSVGDLSDTFVTVWLGMLSDSQYGDHSIACAGMSRVHLDDAAVEAAGFELDFPSWVTALNPSAGDGVAWRLNQTSTSTAVVDATGSGADQVHLDGTSIDADDPPDFSYGGVSAAIAATLPALTGALTGVEIEPGVIAATLPALTGSLTADVDEPGVIAAVLPALTSSLAGTVVLPATINATLPALTGHLTADVDEPGVIAAVLPALTAALVADVDLPGVLAGVLPPLTAHLAATVTPTARIAAILPALAGQLVGHVDSSVIVVPELAGTVRVAGLAGSVSVV